MTNSTNLTGKDTALVFSSQVTWSVLYSVLAVVITFFNTLVILSFAKNKPLRTRTNFFIVSLGCADLLVGLVSLPWYTTLILTKYSNRMELSPVLEHIWVALDILAGVSSILHLTALSWDRLCAIVWPLEHRSYTSRKYLIILCAMWFCTITISALSIVGNDKAFKAYNIAVIILCFFVPLVIICLAQGFILLTIKLKARKQCRNTKLRRDARAAKAISIMTVLFVIGWLPFFTLSLISIINPGAFTPPWDAILAVKFFQYGNSVFNPILYAQKFPEFRKAYMVLVCSCCPAFQPKDAWTTRNSTFRTTLAYLHSPNLFHRQNTMTNLTTRPSYMSPPSTHSGSRSVTYVPLKTLGLAFRKNGDGDRCNVTGSPKMRSSSIGTHTIAKIL